MYRWWWWQHCTRTSLRLRALAARWVVFARRDIGIAVLLPLLFLYQIDIGEHNSFFVLVREVDCLCSSPALLRLLNDTPPPIRSTRTSLRYRNPSLCCVRDHLPDVFSPPDARASQFLTGAGGERTTFFGSGTGAALRFVEVYATGGAAELVAGGEEAFASVAFAQEGFVLGAELVPEGVEGFVVRAVDDVA